MASRFRRLRGARGSVAVSLEDVEVDVLRQLFGEMLELLAEGEPEREDDPLAAEIGIGTSTTLPDDPVLARLFPDAYREDPEAASDFRRYTERGLRDLKKANAAVALATLDRGPGRVVLDAEQAQAWLLALNDLRLALGERLGVTEEGPGPLEDDDPRAYTYAIYDLLTFLQETLVRSLG